MSSIFGGGGGSPAFTPAPIDTSKEDAAKNAAEQAALAESKAVGRRQTMAAGATLAEEDQYGNGLLNMTKRKGLEASQALGARA